MYNFEILKVSETQNNFCHEGTKAHRNALYLHTFVAEIVAGCHRVPLLFRTPHLAMPRPR
jgi:hypothetical protein